MGVVVGASWGRVFNVAFNDLLEDEGMLPGLDTNVKMSILNCCLLIVVLPAWRLFILPKTVAEDKGLPDRPPTRARRASAMPALEASK
eukprot:gnl/TRDRNA2_/TRDRNA2_131478_c0_seq3.p2 gnl/TRDRNA2_/TRDRNA2_131478_c0~~gnl/TRDRNA2_/TRDRNA2_131478_c0_seq3.p2  ORF type:complete len:101 (+),score=19.54 gnl/TRDRNA2_/TRDRNA2_131478_c0_seq3:40-303(+)